MPLHLARRQPVLRRCFAAAAILLTAICAAAPTAPTETWTVRGHIYAGVRVREVTPATVTIFHRGGITQLDLATLPEELQRRFGFDAAKAAEWRARSEEELAAPRVLPTETQRRPPAARPEPAVDETAAVAPVELRPEVDLRPLFRQYGLYLKDQGRRPSCSIFALVGAAEYELARHFGRAEPLSEEFLVWAVNQMQPDVPTDDGHHFDEVVAALRLYGVPRQSLVPNTFGRPVAEIRPSAEAIFDAQSRRDIDAIWFRTDDPRLLEQLVDALNHDTPVVIGLHWPHASTLENNNLLRDQRPLPGAGHAVTLVGYRCPDGEPANLVFIFRNSYGVSWGLGGYAFVAASYLRENILAAFALRIADEPGAAAAR